MGTRLSPAIYPQSMTAFTRIPMQKSIVAYLIFSAILALTAVASATDPPILRMGENLVTLKPLQVKTDASDDYDRTGMGTFENDVLDEPFANELVGASDLTDNLDHGMEDELAAIAEPSSADRISGESRLNLRGFPTPDLRNGFIHIGIPETLNRRSMIIIQGALVPVLGRAAPGGIRNTLTSRPRSSKLTSIKTSISNLGRLQFGYETTGPLYHKKLWQRVAIDWQQRKRNEEFTHEDILSVSAALTWRHSPKVSTMLSMDYRETNATASPSIPQYRKTAGEKIIGPYLPLSNFNANGPHADIIRRSTTTGLQFDTAPTTLLSLRANMEVWWRLIDQDRFTNSQLNLDTGFFSGTREPRHLSQPQEAVSAQLEGNLKFQSLGASHKLLVSVNRTRGQYERVQRALSVADRNALPLSVRRFEPENPNYDRPDFSHATYQRILTDRHEVKNYTSVEISDRMAIQNGRIVLTSGLRFDQISQEITDRRLQSSNADTSDQTGQFSYHAGANFQLFPAKLLLFGTTSTAFDPSTPVDARTGRIQDNETTEGYEAGLRGRALDSSFTYSVSAVLLFNHDISRGNPLYNDPIADTSQTQPQLVASGEERFSGTKFEGKWKSSDTVSLYMKGSYMRAITTASPDLPQEVGRPISRLPAYNVNTSISRRPMANRTGATWALGWQYISQYVANYEDSRRQELAYPGYGLISLNAGYQWLIGKKRISLNTQLRNAFDRDLLASNARNNAQRELTISTRVLF